MKKEIYKVHDKYYKTILSYSNLLDEFVELFFPELHRYLDFKKAKQVKETFIKPNFKDSESDIIYTVPLKKQNVIVYLLIEHQSTPERQIFLRLLGYMLDIWYYVIKKKQTKGAQLPPIIPLVLYNGKAKWGIPKEFKKLFSKAPKALLKHLPLFTYNLFDLNTIGEQKLIKEKKLITAPLYLDKKRDNLEKALEVFTEKLETSNENKEMLKNILRSGFHLSLYYYENKNIEQLSFDFDKLLRTQILKKEIETMAKSAAQQLLSKGKVEGKVEGRVEGRVEEKKEIALKLIKKKKLPIKEVAEITGLSKEDIMKLK